MGGGRTKADKFLRHLQPLQAALVAYCRRSLDDQNEIGDTLQSAIANAYRDFHLYAEGTNFRAWIFRYLNGEIFNRNRRSIREQRREPTHELAVEEAWSLAVDEPLVKVLREDPEEILDQCDQALANAIQDLPSLERSSLLLRAIGDFKYHEIAAILDVPVGTVMSTLSRGRQRLRQRLADFGRERGLLREEASDRE